MLDGAAGARVVTLIDFGVSVSVLNGVQHDYHCTSYHGCPLLPAVADKGYGKAVWCDEWGAGFILLNMLTGGQLAECCGNRVGIRNGDGKFLQSLVAAVVSGEADDDGLASTLTRVSLSHLPEEERVMVCSFLAACFGVVEGPAGMKVVMKERQPAEDLLQHPWLKLP
jgi:hypothetical protein